MFRRLKNLLRLSNYTIEEQVEYRASGTVVHPPRLVNTGTPKGKAKIIDLHKSYNPLDEFNETDK